jgi:hypothetical protein
MKTLSFCAVKRYNFLKRVSKFTKKMFYEVGFSFRTNLKILDMAAQAQQRLTL